ncbi:hydrolase [Vibrio viridaestus]|uniref:hydrolase n=1 Tax=Vibrio viridaestus TaxID=2487322 RepID=UPI003F6DD78D
MPAFHPAPYLSNTHLQTIVPRLLRRQPLFSPFWETLTLPDDDFVDLAWSEPPTGKYASDKPIFVLFHGLEGSFYSPYANGLMHAFSQLGWLSTMMHFRGCSGRSNNYAHAYHSGQTSDPRVFLEYIHKRFPNNPKVAVGISLGGNMLANYLYEYAGHTLLNSAAIVSAPFALSSCSNRVNKGISKIYQTYLLSSLKKNALNKSDLISAVLPITREQITQVKTLRQFDDLLTAPLHQFKDAEDYYSQCSARPRIKNIDIPTLIIHANDDPFMDHDVILKESLPNPISYYLTEHGGHVGFIEKYQGRLNFWLERSLPLYFDNILRDHTVS